MFELNDRVIAVIGAGSGIGEAVATACASQGAVVSCLDLSEEQADRVSERLRSVGAESTSGALDVREARQVADAFAELLERYGRLDGVVCTPGLNVRKRILDYTSEEFDRVVNVNLKGSFNVLQAAGRLMCDRRTGSIVLFSSIRAQVVEPGQGVYAATKAGIVQLARTAAAEFSPLGVRVNALAPGVVDTPLTLPIKQNADWYAAYSSRNALGRWGRAEELAWPCIFLLSDASSYMTGGMLLVDGGWTAIDGRFEPPGMRS